MTIPGWATRSALLQAGHQALDVTSRSLIALIEPGSCFVGMLLELALACDRQYIWTVRRSTTRTATRGVDPPDPANFGPFPMGNG